MPFMWTTILVAASLAGCSVAIHGQWTQCGGKIEGRIYGPEDNCAPGYSCQVVNEWYMQCKLSSSGSSSGSVSSSQASSNSSPAPSSSTATSLSSSSTKVSIWDQFGSHGADDTAINGGDSKLYAPASDGDINSRTPTDSRPATGSSSPTSGPKDNGGAPSSAAPATGSSSSAASSLSSEDTPSHGSTVNQPGGSDNSGTTRNNLAANDENRQFGQPASKLSTTDSGRENLIMDEAAAGSSSAASRLDSVETVSKLSTTDSGRNSNEGTSPISVLPGGKSGKATTTFYGLNTKTACGCEGGWQTSGSGGVYAAAINEANFKGQLGSTYCGSTCGVCYELTSTGEAPSGEGPTGQAQNTMTVMITDACPVKGNEAWCTSPNSQGYDTHFDIAAVPGAAGPLGQNPIVSYRQVACPGGKKKKARSMTQKKEERAIHDNYASCECAKKGIGAL